MKINTKATLKTRVELLECVYFGFSTSDLTLTQSHFFIHFNKQKMLIAKCTSHLLAIKQLDHLVTVFCHLLLCSSITTQFHQILTFIIKFLCHMTFSQSFKETYTARFAETQLLTITKFSESHSMADKLTAIRMFSD